MHGYDMHDMIFLMQMVHDFLILLREGRHHWGIQLNDLVVIRVHWGIQSILRRKGFTGELTLLSMVFHTSILLALGRKARLSSEKKSLVPVRVKKWRARESNLNSDSLARNDLLFWFVYKDVASIKLYYFQHKKNDYEKGESCNTLNWYDMHYD